MTEKLYCHVRRIDMANGAYKADMASGQSGGRPNDDGFLGMMPRQAGAAGRLQPVRCSRARTMGTCYRVEVDVRMQDLTSIV